MCLWVIPLGSDLKLLPLLPIIGARWGSYCGIAYTTPLVHAIMNSMLYLLTGTDEFEITQRLAHLQAVLPDDLRDMNSIRLDGRKLKLDELARACEAMPFLADRRIVIVDEALKHSKAGKERDALKDYLGRVPAACDLIFVEPGEIDKRNAVYTYLRKHAEVIECQPRQGAELLRWVQAYAQAQHASFAPNAAQQLIELAGNDSRTLVTEITRLATYAGRGGQISVAMVTDTVADSHEQSLFTFLDNLSLRRTDAALRGLRALLQEGQAATYILFMLMRQVRILLLVSELQQQRMRPDQMASELRLQPFVVKKAVEQTRGFTPAELVRLHDQLVQLDHATKTGRAQAEVGLELLVLEICGVGG